MRQYQEQQSVVLLLDGAAAADNHFVKTWFKKSRFSTCETTDIFQALEKISDFTTRQRPDIILLEVSSLADDFSNIRSIAQTYFNGSKLLIFALSEDGNTVNHKDCFEGNLVELKAKLNQILPKNALAGRAAAA